MKELIKNINEIKTEISVTCNKEDFLAKCIIDRLENNSCKLDKEMDDLIRRSEKALLKSDATEMCKSLKHLSKIVTVTYKNIQKELEYISNMLGKD